MPSRFAILAMALAAPLLLASCEREAQQQAEVEEPGTGETEAAGPAEPAEPGPAEPPASAEQEPQAPQAGEQAEATGQEPPPATQPGEQAAAEPQAEGEGAAGDGGVTVVPPAEVPAPEGEQQTDEAEDEPPGTRAPGEPSPEAAGVASVAAYVGRWAEEIGMCPRSYWTFTNLRLQSPDDQSCDIESTSEQARGVSLEVACTEQDQPLAEPSRGTMSLVFPNLPETDTMVVSGGPVEDEERSLSRCPPG